MIVWKWMVFSDLEAWLYYQGRIRCCFSFGKQGYESLVFQYYRNMFFLPSDEEVGLSLKILSCVVDEFHNDGYNDMI